MKININFSNKTFYLLISIIGLLAVAGVVIALEQWEIHGHDSDEVRDCEIYTLTDNVVESMSIDISRLCLDEDGCNMYIQRWQSNLYYHGVLAFFYVYTGNEWGTSQSNHPTNTLYRGTNGDTTKSNLLTSSNLGNCIIYDDDTTVETSPTEITFKAASTLVDCVLKICD
jgi:hypothetical protein